MIDLVDVRSVRAGSVYADTCGHGSLDDVKFDPGKFLHDLIDP